MSVSVKNVQEYGTAGFAAIVTVDGLNEWGQPREPVEVNTNRSGNGLWIEGKQVAGTSQFSVRTKTKAAFRAAMYRWFK